MARVSKGWDPSLWASRKPFGIGEQHPNNFNEIARAIWENRDEAGYAWRILQPGRLRRLRARRRRAARLDDATASTSATSACACSA